MIKYREEFECRRGGGGGGRKQIKNKKKWETQRGPKEKGERKPGNFIYAFADKN
jgi:hypothetical protein